MIMFTMKMLLLYIKNSLGLTAWALIASTTMATTLTFASAVSVALQSTVESSTILHSTVTPHSGVSSTPPLEVSREIQFVPLTREFIELLEDKEKYNRYATPRQYDRSTTTNVSMSMYIEGISSFSAQTMDYQLDMYFYQEWADERLQHNGTGPMLIRDKAVFKKIWHPDIYFANARQASFQEITEDNFLLWVYPSGRIWYDCRISLVAICMMDLWKYPLDSQTCELRILSYAYPESQLRLRWSETISPPIDRNKEIRMPDMRLVDITTGECNGTYATGRWSCMTAIFYVQREMMHHVMQTYIPTALIVVISWFNFWLDIDSAPARVSLSITTLLTIATQANAVKLALPEVSYMKAIDCWMGMCMTFVFGVMVEYTIAHYAKNQEMHRVIPSSLLVDSTITTLFGDASNNSTNGPQTTTTIFSTPNYDKRINLIKNINNNASDASVYKHSAPLRLHETIKNKQQNNTGVFPSFGNLQRQTLKPEEPDIHTIIQQYPMAFHEDYDTYGDEEEEEEDELSMTKGYEEEPISFNEQYSVSNNKVHATTNYNNNGVSRDSSFYKTNCNDVLHNNKVLLLQNSNENYIPSPNIVEPMTSNLGTKLDILPEESEAEIIQTLNVREKKGYSVGRFRKRLARRAHFMKKSMCILRGRAMANKIDQKSRILFPGAFIIVNIIYWSYYLVFN